MLMFNGIQHTEAEEEYTRAQIDTAFTNTENYIIHDLQTSNMSFDEVQMKADRVSKQDIKIVLEFAELNNGLMDLIANENSTEAEIKDYFASLDEGQFKQLFNPSQHAKSYTGSYFSLTACGITFGVTAHEHDGADNGLSGYSSLSSIQDAVEADGYYQVQYPWADLRNVGVDYSKINTTGFGGCTDGEFRDEWNIYDDSRDHIDAYRTSEGWHTLNHDNEPNPELLDYFSPTYWWGGFVSYWHDHY